LIFNDDAVLLSLQILVANASVGLGIGFCNKSPVLIPLAASRDPEDAKPLARGVYYLQHSQDQGISIYTSSEFRNDTHLLGPIRDARSVAVTSKYIIMSQKGINNRYNLLVYACSRPASHPENHHCSMTQISALEGIYDNFEFPLDTSEKNCVSVAPLSEEARILSLLALK
jgi:hypothetical protein